MYDYIVIGGGISGLSISNRLENTKILLIEKNDYLGGRIKTVKLGENNIEAGAARFNSNHKLLIKLLKEFKLFKDIIKISNNKTYFNLDLEKCPKNIVEIVVKELSKFTDKELLNNTIISLCKKIFDKTFVKCFTDSFFYYSEIHKCNAFDALRSLKYDLNENKQFYILKGGMTRLIDSIEKKIKLYTDIIKNTFVVNIEYVNKQFLVYTKGNEDRVYEGKKLIVASGKSSMTKIPFFKKISKNLNSIELIPLVRIYAVYPKINGKVWFDGLTKVITKAPIKFIIPISYDKGIIMISYVDGKYSNHWKKHQLEGTLEKEVNKEVSKIFTDRKIPKPKKIKAYFWNEGISVWKPGYKSKIIFKKMIKPMRIPLFVCGENFSINNGWIEGSLDTANRVFKKINKSQKRSQKAGSDKKTKKWKKYTLDEVKKHNTESDAWTVINDKVLNITEWVPKHPGGKIIRNGFGINATEMFKFHNHSTQAKEKLNDFQIGILI